MDNSPEFGVLPEGREGISEKGARRESQGGGSHPPGEEAGGGGSELPSDAGEKLHRIRDLLFGEAARDQSQRVDSLEITFAAALADAEERFQARLDAVVAAAEAGQAELKRGFEQEILSLRADLASTEAELHSAKLAVDNQARSKVERSDFAAMLGELAKKVGEDQSDDV